MPLNKPALLALNQTNFPDNTQQLITPVLLRDFNTQMIASMELTQSMSDYAVLNGGNSFIGSQSIDGYVSIDKTKALNTNAIYWNNNTVGYTNLEIINSASGNLDLSARNGKIRIITSSLDIVNGTFSASLENGYAWVGDGNNRTSLVPTSSFGSVTSAITASSLITASFSGNTLTFTKGDSSTFGVVIPDVSGSTIPAGTISGSSQITALGFVSSSVTGSSLITGSVSGNVLTFTKGDATQFSLTVATGSGGGGTIDTGSFATTGSNTFNGNQNITGSLSISPNENINIGNEANNSNGRTQLGQFNNRFDVVAFAGVGNTNPKTLFIYDFDSVNTNGATFTASLQQGYTWVGNGSNISALVPTSSFGGSTNTGSLMVTGSVNVNVLTFTKGDGSTFDLTVAASGSSPAGTVSSSQQILNYNIFATTGSNDFVGTQNISSSGDGITLLGYGNRLNFGGTQTTDRAWLNLAESDGTNQGTALQFTGVNTGVGFNVGDSATPSTGSTPVAFENTSRSGSILFQNSGNTGQIRLQNNTGSINLQAGSSISISGSSTTIQDVNFIPFSASLNSRILAATGSSINTGSFATTGSNIFIGDQTITGSVNVSGGEHLFIKRSTAGANQLLRLGATDNENNFAFIVTGSDTNPGQQVWGINTMGGTWGNSFDAGVVFNSYVTASQGLNVGDAGTFSAPLQNGYVWVGNSSGRNTTAPTSSFGGSTNTGSLMTTGSVSGNVLTFTKGDATTFTLTVATGSGGGGSTDTGSLLVTASFNTNQITFTKGDASQFQLVGIATTGSNTFTGQQTLNANNNVVSGSITFNGTSVFNNTASLFNSVKLNNSIFNVSNFLQIDVASGSIVLQTPSAANGISGLGHLSASSANSQVNLVFKNSNNTGTTSISGSNNIFTNPATPTTGYKRFIGGNNNFYLNHQNGITSQITASANAVSGLTPTMHNNIFAGTGNFSINQAVNSGTHTYSQNIIGGTGNTTINALGFTGSLNLNSNFNNNGTITINAASASVTEITSGISGSGTVTILNNGIFGGTITNTSPRTLLTTNTQQVLNNVLAGGAITVTNISSSAAVGANGNVAIGGMTYSNAGAAGLGLHTTAGNMNTSIGALNFIASASAISAANNISPAAMTVTNRVFSGSLGLGAMQFNNNQTQGASNTYTATGSFGGTISNVTGPVMQANGIFGASNTLFTNVEGRGNYVDVRNNLIGGTFLILTGSNNLATTGSGGGYFGRFNANDGLRNGTAENILVIGTGTSADNRKTGFLIDSGSNSYFEGTLNVSGSTTMTGSLILSSSNATELFVIGDSQFTGSISIAPTFQAKFATGSNQQAGTAVLDGGNPGTVTVSNSLVTANSIIMLTKQTLTNAHMVAVSSKGAGTFTITSNGNGDADTVGWFIINNS